jgi:hypothetical protein
MYSISSFIAPSHPLAVQMQFRTVRGTHATYGELRTRRWKAEKTDGFLTGC